MIEINNTTKQKIDKKEIERVVARFLRTYKKSGVTVSLAIVGSARMKWLNLQYRKIAETTDVLSFPGEGKYLGEVIINIQETKKTAKYREVFKEKRSASYVFYFLLVHGLLHLVGYDDKTDEERLAMLRRGEKFLTKAL
jgi:probable rRNA maturation factor